MNARQSNPDNPEGYFLASEMFEVLGATKESLNNIQKALELSAHPPLQKDLLKVLELNLALNDLDSFYQGSANFVPVNDSEKADIAYLNALALFLQNKPADARELLNKTVSTYPKHAKSHLLLAKIALTSNQLKESYALVSKALEIDPHLDEAFILQGYLALKLEDFEQAEKSFTFALLELKKLDVMTPKKYQILSGLVTALNKLGQQHKALQYTDILAKSRPGQLKSSYNDALSALSERDVKTAQQELQKVLHLAPSHAPSNYLMGVTKLQQGDLTAAEKHLSSALAGKNVPEKTRIALIFTRLQSKHFNEAQILIDDALSKSPNDATYLSLRGNLLTLKGEAEQAEQSFKAALEKDKNFLPALGGLAKIYEVNKNFDMAKQQLIAAASADPDNRQVISEIVRFGVRNKQVDWSLEEVEKLSRQNRQSSAPIIILAAYYLQQQDIKNTQKHLDKAATISPGDKVINQLTSNLHILKASEAVKTGESNKALSHLDQSIALASDNMTAQFFKVSLLVKNGKTKDAIDIAKNLQQNEKYRKAGLELEGNIWTELAQFTSAAEAYDKLWNEVKNSKLAVKIYRIKKEYSNTNQAMEHVRAWVKDNPKELPALITLAILEQENSNTKEAISLYEQALSMKRDNALVLNNLSYIYYKQGDARAVDLAEQAFALAPKSAAVADTYGWILVENDQLEKGLPILKQAAQSAPKSKEILQHYSEALARAGKLDEAAIVMEKITKL